ncbi:MAG: hypothetical protein HDR03_13130 [Lachnospiraceae bacterium]|nr:hypothetical protein [Lachnospiraceae bacterium]
MKKIFAIILVLCMTFTLAACSAQSGETTADNKATKLTAESQENEQQVQDESDDTNTSVPEETVSDTGEADTSAEETGSKVLVAYFSCTGNTEGIAGHIVNILGADVYQIVPEEPYTDADLNYNDSSSRTTIEMNDSTSRPAISGSVENMEDYDIIFIGYAGGIIGLN